MPVYHGRDLKKPTGGKRSRNYKVKRKALAGDLPTSTVLSSSEERKIERGRGGERKIKLSRALYANLSVGGKSEKVKILRVLEVPANKEYARKGLIVKGAIIETSAGKAVVTSRPGQDGVVNAVLLEKK